MKNWIALLLLAVLVLVGLGSLSASARQPGGTWEYVIAYTDAIGGLNKLGQEGWEAVAVYTPASATLNSPQVLMKRRKN